MRSSALVLNYTTDNDASRTESYDHMEPVGVDPRWDAFGPFHDYLLRSFPLVYVLLFIGVDSFLITFNRFAVIQLCR